MPGRCRPRPGRPPSSAGRACRRAARPRRRRRPCGPADRGRRRRSSVDVQDLVEYPRGRPREPRRAAPPRRSGSTSISTAAASLKMPPNSTRNISGNRIVKNSAVRSRTKPRASPATGSGRTRYAHARYSRPVRLRKTSSRVAPLHRQAAQRVAFGQRGQHRAGSRVAMVSETPSSSTSSDPPDRAVPPPTSSAPRLDGDAGGRVEPADQRGRRAELQDLAVVHDGHPVAEHLGLVHVVGGQHDRAPGVVDAAQQVPQVAPGLRVERRRRLVEEHQLRVVHQRAGDRQPLLLAAGQLLGRSSALSPARPCSSISSAARPATPYSDANVRICSRAVSRSKNDDACSCTPMRGSSRVARPRRLAEHPDLPASGLRSPSMISSVVVLPAPLGPRMPKNSPASTSNETPSTARTSPYVLLSSSTLISAPMACQTPMRRHVSYQRPDLNGPWGPTWRRSAGPERTG